MLSSKVAIATIMKNEGPYVLEWLAWHRLIGISAFLIADNGGDDGMSELLVALDRIGIIHRIDFPYVSAPGQPVHQNCYKKILADHSDVADWLLCIDADEFLRPARPAGGFSDFVDSIPADVGAVAINWMTYGSSWRTAPGSGPVMGRFAYRGEQTDPVNRHYKMLLRSAAATGTVPNPHHMETAEGYRHVDTSMADLVVPGPPGKSARVLWDRLWIQHYVIKSWSEFWHKKVSRGRASAPTGTFKDNFFELHDKNAVYDPLPADLHVALMAEISRLRMALAGLPSRLRDLDLTIADLASHRVLHPSLPAIRGGPTPGSAGPRGVIDRTTLDDGGLTVIGWIMTGDGRPVERIGFLSGDRHLPVSDLHRVERPDVRKVFPHASGHCGYRARIDAAALAALPPSFPLNHCIAAHTEVVGTSVDVRRPGPDRDGAHDRGRGPGPGRTGSVGD